MSSRPVDGPPLFLASVVSADEARVALAYGAEIIDCKNPEAGALGPLPLTTVAEIREAAGAGVRVSATIGDLAPEPSAVVPRAAALAEIGVDFVKIGFFEGGDPRATIRALGEAKLGGTRVVGLFLAEHVCPLNLLEEMAEAGFAGVMIDTALKDGRALLDHLSTTELQEFIDAAHCAGLFAGLAGSLRIAHIPALLGLGADVLGFRGALCPGGRRESFLTADAIARVADALGLPRRRRDATPFVHEAIQ